MAREPDAPLAALKSRYPARARLTSLFRSFVLRHKLSFGSHVSPFGLHRYVVLRLGKLSFTATISRGSPVILLPLQGPAITNSDAPST